MFSDKSFEPTQFVSAVTSDTTAMSNTTQTTHVGKKCQEVQKLEHRNCGTQTVNIEDLQTPKVDYDKLAAFLKRITPDILEALDEPYFDANTAGTLTVSKPQARLLTKFSTLNESNSQKKISAISWSTNGGTLAISYSARTHETWCDHLSEVKLYEFTRHDKLCQDSSATYETNSCVSCLSYHPTEPSILSAGLFNGDIILWNLTSDDLTTPSTVYTHDDTVTSLIWRSRTINEPALLVTSSSDGYIIFHKISVNFTNIDVHSRYKIIKEHNPAENVRPRSAGGPRERAIEAGLSITGLDFSPKNPNIFIVGTLCGGLYKCSTEAVIKIQGDDSLIDPIIDKYDRCDGSVTCVKCSPINNIFVSSDTNKQMRIYNLEETSCVEIINVEYTITGLQYIISNKDIIFAYGADPIVKCFDISNDTICPKFEIECSTINSGCLDINKKRDAVGIADTQNNLEVWAIPKMIE